MKIPAASLRRVVMAGGLAGIAGTLLFPGFSTGLADPPKQGDNFPDRILRGWVELRPMGTVPIKGGTLHVYVEKGPQDRPSKVLMELIQPDFSYGNREDEKIPFALGPFEPRKGTSYRVRVHLDANNDGRKTFGDYFKVVSIFEAGGDSPIVITADYIDQRGVQISARKAEEKAAVAHD